LVDGRPITALVRPGLEPRDHIGIEADGHRLLLRCVETASDALAPVRNFRKRIPGTPYFSATIKSRLRKDT
jgi:hypothetical protein